MPADTWTQPAILTPLEEITNNKIPEAMKKLQDDIFRLNIGVDISNLLRQMLSLSSSSNEPWKESMENRIFPLAKKFTLALADPEYGPNIPLGEARTILRSIGPYVYDLCVDFIQEKWPQNLNRYFYKMCQYVGPNLKILRMKQVAPNEDWLLQLKPLLSRIESLYVRTSNYDFDFDIDFQSFCPNLKTLNICMNLKGEFLAKPWPKLEGISNRNNQYMEERLVQEFMKNNPQLKYFDVAANDCENLLQQIPEHLVHLEELCLYQGYPSITGDNLTHLTDLKKLKKLKLKYLDEEDFDGIVNCLPKFKQLLELKLHLFYDGPDSVDAEELYEPNLQSIVSLAQDLHQLECFQLSYCQINATSLNDFIRNARNLKQIRISRCGLEINDVILENIEATRETINPTKLLFYADKISLELNKEVKKILFYLFQYLCGKHTYTYFLTFISENLPLCGFDPTMIHT